MNQINFENEFDDRLEDQFETKLDALLASKVETILASTFGDAYTAMQAIPAADQEDSVSLYVDTDVLKVSTAGA